MTNYDQVLEVLRKAGKPLQRKDFRESLTMMDDLLLAVVLNHCMKKGLIIPVKYPGMPAFYCHPDWVKDGVVPGWDHIYKQWKIKPDGVKNQSA